MKLKVLISTVILCTGLWHVSASGYMLSKSWLSQILIKLAWQQTLLDKQQHKPWSWADTFPVASLQVPRLAVSSYVLEGSSGRNLAFSATHLSQSGMPGQQKTTVISGHNDSHFGYLQQLLIGDEILLTTVENNIKKISSYRVSSTQIVDSKKHQLKIFNRDELLLTTCYPFDSLTAGGHLRYVIHAIPVT